MPKIWKNILLSLTGASLFFTACKQESSDDKPLPISYSPTVIINSDNNIIYALNPITGLKAWEQSLPNISPVLGAMYAPSPLVYHNRLYIVRANSDTIYKLNPSNGAILKKFTLPATGGFAYQATPIADGNLIYLAHMNGTLYAIDTGTFDIKWKYSSASPAPLSSSPTINGNYIYQATMGGHVYCIHKTIGPDPTTGEIEWDYPGAGVPSTASFTSSPAVGAPYLFVGSSTDSSMYCIYLMPPVVSPPTHIGILRWTYKTSGNIYSSPAAVAGRCIFGSTDHYIYCLDTFINPTISLSPNYIWRTRTNSQVYSSPVVSNQTVYIGSNDYNLYALTMITGGIQWKFTSGGLIKSSPLVYDGVIYIGSYDKYLYAVDATLGTMKWSQNINGNIQCSPVIDDLSGTNQHNSQISGFTN